MGVQVLYVMGKILKVNNAGIVKNVSVSMSIRHCNRAGIVNGSGLSVGSVKATASVSCHNRVAIMNQLSGA